MLKNRCQIKIKKREREKFLKGTAADFHETLGLKEDVAFDRSSWSFKIHMVGKMF